MDYKAAGVLFTDSKQRVLMAQRAETKRYEDLGGKREEKDQDEFCTAAREVHEETNGHLSMEWVLAQLKQSKTKRLENGQYVLFMISLSDENETLSSLPDLCGEKESNSDNERTLHWIPWIDFPEIVGTKLGERLFYSTPFYDAIIKEYQRIRKVCIPLCFFLYFRVII